jgi:hypothetical protein
MTLLLTGNGSIAKAVLCENYICVCQRAQGEAERADALLLDYARNETLPLHAVGRAQEQKEKKD